ncbi:MAG: ROK family protein [Bacillota bacterium]
MNVAMISNTTVLRKNNRNRLVKFLSDQTHEVTKQEIAENLHLSMPTVTQNLVELIAETLVVYTKPLSSSGGRKPKGIIINENAKISIGISLSYRHARLIALNLRGEEIAFEKIPFCFLEEKNITKDLLVILENFIATYQLEVEKIIGVGLTVPGIINQEGYIEFAPTLEKENLTVMKIDETQFPYRVLMENDASAGAYAEWHSEKTKYHVAYLFIERGVGGSILIDGQTYRGENNRSAEFGHMCVQPRGKLCNCGLLGCLEAYCSTDRLSDDLDITLEEFFEGVAEKNETYIQILEVYLDHLADGIALIRQMLNSDIIIGGMLAQHLEPHMEGLRKRLAERLPITETGTYLQLAKHRTKAACTGVALHLITAFIESV